MSTNTQQKDLKNSIDRRDEEMQGHDPDDYIPEKKKGKQHRDKRKNRHNFDND